MPGPMGGFSLSDVLQQYHQADQFVEGIKSRREKREEEEKQAANPNPRALLQRQKFMEEMGPNYNQPDPDTDRQLGNLAAPKGGWRPGQRESYEEQARRLPTIQQQGRILRFKANLGKKMEELNQQRTQNMVTEAALNEAIKNGTENPEHVRGILETQRRALADATAGLHSTMQMGYEDIWDHPEVQAALKEAVTKGILGPGPTMGGQPGARWGGTPQAPAPGGLPSSAPQAPTMGATPMPPWLQQLMNRGQ